MRERLEDLEEGEDVKNCECSADRPMPGRVLIAVFCGVCGSYMDAYRRRHR